MGKQMRKSLESVMTRRRTSTRGLLMAAADAEEARALRGQPTGSDAPSAPTTTATPSATATATATASATAGALQAAVKAEEGTSTAAATTAAAAAAAAVTALLPEVHTAADLQLAARIAPFKQLSLSSDLLGAALQLWDFLQAFYPLLHLKRPPSLDELAGALASADAAAAAAATAAAAASSTTSSTALVVSSKSRLEGLRLLHKLGSKLAQLFAPSLLGALGLAMTAGEGEDEDVAADRAQRLTEQLSGLLTWEEVARLALQVQPSQHTLTTLSMLLCV
jgi:DDT domain